MATRAPVKGLSEKYNIKVEIIHGGSDSGYKVVIPDVNGDHLVASSDYHNTAISRATVALPILFKEWAARADGDANSRT